jgi:hypothetical protein
MSLKSRSDCNMVRGGKGVRCVRREEVMRRNHRVFDPVA